MSQASESETSASEQQQQQHGGASAQPYEPSILDVIVVKAMLTKTLHTRSLHKLPPELVDSIVDFAEYWPHTSVEVGPGRAPYQRNENIFLLRTTPLGFPRSSIVNHTTAPTARKLTGEFPTDYFQKLIGSPIRNLAQPCRKIVFTITSQDQGWGGERGHQGTYNGSWTWFEAGLERLNKKDQQKASDVPGLSSLSLSPTSPPTPQQQAQAFNTDNLATVYPEVRMYPDDQQREPQFNHPLLPQENLKIQCNVTASGNWKTHTVVWSCHDDLNQESQEAEKLLGEQGRGTGTGNGEFVRGMKLGDVVTVWAKVRFPGWLNSWRKVKVDVYWAV